MRRWLAAFALVASCASAFALRASARQAAPFDFGHTIRVDYLHSGGPGGERLVLDAVVAEGEWPGSRTQLIDTSDLGKYVVEVVDRLSDRVIYSRGFASLYGEWETTAEFRKIERTFHESVRFPRPQAPVRISVAKRDAANVFRPLWTQDVDPAVARA